MDFHFLDDLKKASDLKKEKENMKKIKADIISASDTEGKKAIYKYFNGEAIIDSLSMSADVAKKARELIKGGKIKLENVSEERKNHIYRTSFYHDYESDIYGKAVAKVESNDDCEVSIEFDKESLYSAYCSCRKCISKNRINSYFNDKKNCEHVVAAVFLLNAYLDSHELGDETNYFGNSLLSYFDEEHVYDSEAVKIVPKLILDDDRLYIQFKIGRKKFVQIKKYVDFVGALRDNDVYPLGKNDSVKLGYSAFEENSIKYIKFIEEIVDREAAISYSLLDNPKTRLNTSRIPVDASNIDELFELLSGEKIELTNETFYEKKVSEIELRDHNERIGIMINPIYDRGQFAGINLNIDFPMFLNSNKYIYCLKDNYFNRCDENILKFFSALKVSEYGYRDINIGRRNIGRFYSNVLPAIREFSDIVDNAPEAVEFVPEKADITYYLDMEKDTVIGRAEAFYSGGKVDVISGKVIDRNDKELLRDQRQEQRAVEILKRYLPQYTQGNYLSTSNEDELYELKISGIEILNKYGKVLGSESFNNVRVYKKPSAGIGVSVKSNLLRLEILSEDMSPDELANIVISYRKKKKYYRLKSGAFIDMDSDYLKNFNEMLNVLEISSKDLRAGALCVPLYRSLYIDEMMAAHEELVEKRDESFAKLIEKFDNIKNMNFTPPPEVKNILREYQKEGFKWLRSVEELGFGGILADDMGLGKTLQIISFLMDAKKCGRLRKAIIVCPASLVYNWSEEISKFDTENILTVSVLAAGKEERQKILEDHDSVDIYISSYDTLRRDISLYHDIKFSHQIIDEAQFIKNQNTGVAKAVKALKADVKFALTGTPIENRLSELWSIFDYIMPGFLYSYNSFRSKYENSIVKDGDENSAKLLSKMISPFVLRRLKSEVAMDLPDKIEEIRTSRFDKEQQLVYDIELSRLKEVLEGDKEYNSSKMIILSEITKLRQICCDPGLIFENYSGGAAKLETCVDLVKSGIEAGHKILLFSQFTSMLDIIEKRFKEENISSYMITGSTSKEKRIQLVNDFNNDDTNVFLISLKAGGTGLNLVGADIVIHYDPWWNFAAQNQATDRAHRIGQKNNVTVYRLITKGTIEERIVKLQESKKDLADRVLNFEEGVSLANISKEELLELLG